MTALFRSVFSVIGLCGLMFASGAMAQDMDDWDFLIDPERTLTVAGVQFGGGVSVSVQCQADQLSLILGGAPASDAFVRPLSLTRGDGLSRRSYVKPVDGSALVQSGDVRAIRFLRAGGRVMIASVAGDARPMRMQIDLPMQSSNVDKVLTACRYPLVDARDQLADASELVVKWPSVEMPTFSDRYTVVEVELSCIVAESRLTACQSDHETPYAPEVGDATARRANGSSITLQDGASADGQLLEIVVTGRRVRR